MVDNGVDCGSVLDGKDVWQSMVLNSWVWNRSILGGLIVNGYTLDGYVLNGCVLGDCALGRSRILDGRMRMNMTRVVPWHVTRVVGRKCRVVARDRGHEEAHMGIIIVLRALL